MIPKSQAPRGKEEKKTKRNIQKEESETGSKKEGGGGEFWGGKGRTHTMDTRGTDAVEAHSIAGAGATSPTGLRLTGILSKALAALGATPARLTLTAEPGGGGSQGWHVGRGGGSGAGERPHPPGASWQTP